MVRPYFIRVLVLLIVVLLLCDRTGLEGVCLSFKYVEM